MEDGNKHIVIIARIIKKEAMIEIEIIIFFFFILKPPFYFYALGINHTLKNLPDFIWEMPALEEVLVDEKLEKNISSEKRREVALKLTLAGRNHEIRLHKSARTSQ